RLEVDAGSHPGIFVRRIEPATSRADGELLRVGASRQAVDDTALANVDGNDAVGRSRLLADRVTQRNVEPLPVGTHGDTSRPARDGDLAHRLMRFPVDHGDSAGQLIAHEDEGGAGVAGIAGVGPRLQEHEAWRRVSQHESCTLETIVKRSWP